MLILTIIFACIGLSCAGLGLLFVERKIGPNPWWGFRVPDTLADSQFWYQANTYIGKWLVATGVALSVAAVGLYGMFLGGALTPRWYHLEQGDGTIRTIYEMVPLGMMEMLLFGLPFLALNVLVLAIQTFPELFWRRNQLAPQRPVASLPASRRKVDRAA